VALGGAGKVAGEVAAEVAGKAGKAAAQIADHAPPLVKVAKKPNRSKAVSPAQAVSAGPARGGASKLPASSAPSASGAYVPSPENTARMERGRAPIGVDGRPVEIHHEAQRPDGRLIEMTQTQHRGGDNFRLNHGNIGQQPSSIDRQQFAKDRRAYWRQQAAQQRRQGDEK
jgi:hypothetical protein